MRYGGAPQPELYMMDAGPGPQRLGARFYLFTDG